MYQLAALLQLITLPDATGAPADLHAQSKSSKLTMVMFWASWCPHCTDAMPAVKRMMDTYRAQGLVFMLYRSITHAKIG
jgi:thiol-disulfide isomerase/thioredoxin